MPKQRKETVTGRVLHDPVKDKLRPMFPLDLSRCQTIDDLVRGMGNTAFTGRQIGDAADIVEAMARDKDCFVVMTLSGALTVAKMGLVFCDLIESGVVNAIVSTGALMAHGLVEATGLSHFRYNPAMDDKELFEAGYNRVYDSLERCYGRDPEQLGCGGNGLQLEATPQDWRILGQKVSGTGDFEVGV